MPARKPSKLKQLQGTERPHRVNKDEPKPVAGRPDSYLPIDGLALELYDKIAADLSALGVLATTDGGVIYDAAVNLAELADLRAQIEELKGDQERFNEWHSMTVRKESASKQHRAYMQTLGLTPVDRARVSVIDTKDKSKSPWADFIQEAN
jgi:hypothetical protein